MQTEKRSGLWWRVMFTGALLIICNLMSNLTEPTDTLIRGQLAAETLKPSDTAYIAQQSFPGLTTTMQVGSAVFIIVMWAFYFRRRKCAGGTDGHTHGPSCRHAVTSLALGFVLVGMTGCIKPPKLDIFEEVGPNETAFVIPLQGNNISGQGKFDSAEYLNSKKVAAKRILIPLTEKKIGRWDYEIEWIPAVRVIKVNRAMVSREWSPATPGTTEKDESIPVVTKDSIQLGVGVAVTAFIEEEDAATYLYYHGDKPLKDVMDANIRNWCVAELTKAYGQMDLQEAQTNFPSIFAKIYVDAQKFFKTKGVSIQQFGNAEGYEFKRPEIQKALNATFIAEQDNKTAAQEKIAQDTRNQKLLASARTEREAAEELFKAKEAANMKNNLEIQQINAKANLEMATKWNGALPANILPSGSPLLMNLGGTK